MLSYCENITRTSKYLPKHTTKISFKCESYLAIFDITSMMSSFLSLLDALLKSFLSVMGSIWSVDSLGNSSLSSKFLQYFSKFWCIQFSVSGRYERRSVHWCVSGFYYASWAPDCYHTGSVLTVLYGDVFILVVKSFHIKQFLPLYFLHCE